MIAEFPTVDQSLYGLAFAKKKKIEPLVFIPSVLQFMWRGLAIAFKNFNSIKLIIVLVNYINDWLEAAIKEVVLQK